MSGERQPGYWGWIGEQFDIGDRNSLVLKVFNRMKPYEDLTYIGKIRRLRQLASKALEAYGFFEPRVKFIRDSGNILFRVHTPDRDSYQEDHGLYLKNTYALRLHQPDYQSTEAIASELAWLVALRKDADLPVAEPVRALNGEFIVETSTPGVPKLRRCSLLRWIQGRNLSPERIQPGNLRAAGRLMAKLHQHAAQWSLPPGFTRPRYDWEGLYGNNSFSNVPAQVVEDLIPGDTFHLYHAVVCQLHQVMTDLGTGSDAFGLIHADLCIGENLLYWRDHPRVVDFDDCAFGYWMFDIGVSLAGLASERKEWYGTNAWLRNTTAFLEGYHEVSLIQDEQLKHLALFSAAWHAFEIFWAGAMSHLYPDHRAASLQWIARAAGDLRTYFDIDSENSLVSVGSYV